jgi:predicted SPOUT superfamily RNA methylase MTH1
LKTILAGQIARAATVFCIDEIVVFDDTGSSSSSWESENEPSSFLMLLLSFLECPPNLRKRLFPLSQNLRAAGMLPSLDAPHHLKLYEWCQYREGVAVGPLSQPFHDAQGHKRKKSKHDATGSSVMTLVDAGFPVAVAGDIPPGSRVTLKFDTSIQPKDFPFLDKPRPIEYDTRPFTTAEVQDPASPREESGYYWGYSVRKAKSLSTVFTECPFEQGYDLSIGTSERGRSLYKLLSPSENELPPFASHVLIVLGGVAGLETAVEADKELTDKGITKNNVEDLFDFYVDVCPGQGSRTIRTEEALTIALSQLRQWTSKAVS